VNCSRDFLAPKVCLKARIERQELLRKLPGTAAWQWSSFVEPDQEDRRFDLDHGGFRERGLRMQPMKCLGFISLQRGEDPWPRSK